MPKQLASIPKPRRPRAKLKITAPDGSGIDPLLDITYDDEPDMYRMRVRKVLHDGTEGRYMTGWNQRLHPCPFLADRP